MISSFNSLRTVPWWEKIGKDTDGFQESQGSIIHEKIFQLIILEVTENIRIINNTKNSLCSAGYG